MCGIFGIFGHPEAANITYLGLHALQHRGQESAGIVTTDERTSVVNACPGMRPLDTFDTRRPGIATFETRNRLQSTMRAGRLR